MASQDGEQVLAEIGSFSVGLSSAEARQRLHAQSHHSFQETRFSMWSLLVKKLRSTFLYLLLTASAISYFLGDRFEALLILLFVVINISLETYQEYHAQKSLRLLKQYLVTHTRVRRNGEVMMIESQNVVVGDIVIVEAGDRLSADMRFLITQGLTVDESLMTGESVAVTKTDSIPEVMPTEVYEAKNIGFAGTVVMTGRGEGVVFALGAETALGDIALLMEDNDHKTEFEKGIVEFSRFVVKLVIFTIALMFIANIVIRGNGVGIGELLVFSLALAVSVVPEALPVIVTMALSRGSLRLAHKKVVVKRLSAIEDLGSIEILCTDKTGTLTENVLTVSQVHADHPNLCLQLAFAAALEAPGHHGGLHDAFDIALQKKLSSEEQHNVSQWERLNTIPFDPERRRNSVLLKTATQKQLVVRGAPEDILRLSKNMTVYTKHRLMEWIQKRGNAGERVLAVACRTFSGHVRYSPYEEQELEFIGLISFVDGIKHTAKATVAKARSLNVQVKILTGDSPEVAGAVGCAVGLLQSTKEVVVGKTLFSMSEATRRQTIVSASVFARVSPREKYEIIKVLQEHRSVGFLGEGINDAPALKIADVGIVVKGAADIAREAADVVLLQKNLDTIIDGIKEGRAIFANILKYLRITLTSNFGNFYSVALASLFLPFIPLLPIQILLLNLLSDFPMIAIATDTVDDNDIAQPKTHNIHAIILMATLFGGVSSLFDFMLFGIFAKVSPETLQTAWFLLSVITEVFLIFSLRTRLVFFRAQRPSWLLLCLSFIALGTAFLTPFLILGHEAFHFIQPDQTFFMTIALLAIGYFFATEITKFLYYHHWNGTNLHLGKNKKRHLAV